MTARRGGSAVLPGPAGWADPERPRLVLVDPATEAPRALLPLSRGAEVAEAVARARRAVGTGDRLAILERLIGEIEARREDMAQAISQDMGSPIDFARSKQVEAACDHLRATLNAARTMETVSEIAPGGHEVAYEPAGVAALVTPWNWPLNQVALKVGGALAAGCSMILKPSELSTGAALIFAECMQAAGAPEGLFTVLAGDGETGRLLASHPDIGIASFTGSTSVGRQIAAAAGANLVPVLLELGGKSANLLFSDCDLAVAVKQGVAHCFRNSGQSCNAASRMLVAREVYGEAVALAAAEAAEWRMGAPAAAGGHLGPLVSQAQHDRVQTHIEAALEDGARLVAGGPGRAEGFARGWYPRPTVFADVTPEMRLFREEVFGPVLSITPFDSEEEAVRLANEGDYGLAGYVQTADPARQRRVAAGLKVGMVQINGRSRAEGAPFGGVRQSGHGREAGIWGIRAFQTVKSVSGLDPL
ncbi:aldehyde dehydrogenase family protein [Mangrovicoccus sp. HB161399]|uniref:aldehyde dehydrogenase family protein n=1 Tax=Mangrovicoccus sp. HB161399 TaxID=2720392 RepID=UPI00352CF428